MTCYHPMTAYRLAEGGITFTPPKRRGPEIVGEISLPCRGCIGCRLAYADAWAARCSHEAQMHSENCWLTLTYAPEHLPEHGTLRYRDVQLFLKRYRKEIQRPLRYFLAGEYGGGPGARPHYHICVFGHRFSDLTHWSTSEAGGACYRSKLLDRLWGLGIATVSELNEKTAGYTARYCLKKINGDRAEAHYSTTDPDTGEVHELEPEFAHMSTRPGIGATWLAKYLPDVFPHDFVVRRGGRKTNVPAYYDRLLARIDPDAADHIKAQRPLKALARAADNTAERLAVRETVKLAKIRSLQRKGV